MKEVIKMLTTQEEKTQNRRLFVELGAARGYPGLPGVDGAINCTHIKLTHSRLNPIAEVYRNRKGYFSINVQVAVGPQTQVLDIVPEWPGCEHDSRIFQNSRLFMRCQQGKLDGRLVGDAGYTCMTFLLNPVPNPANRGEEMYNFIQSRTRRIVERFFGIIKRRFPCLCRGLGIRILGVRAVVVACAVLHNLSLVFDRILPEDEQEMVQEDEVPVERPIGQGGNDGRAVRAAMINRLYGNH